MTPYLAWIVDFVGRHPHYAVTAIFLLAFSEAVPVVGTVVPGSTLIIGICALATGAHVNPWPLFGAAIVLSPGRLAILLIVGLIAVWAAGHALRCYLNQHPLPQASLSAERRPGS
jgi:hypothetical protein